MASNNCKANTFHDDAASTYSATSTTTLTKEKKEATRKWLSKNKAKKSPKPPMTQAERAEKALHTEALADVF
ncbi:hypothetical protein P175DRAFT_0535574 [Aspergillus ochraceoroseus IBT 24754]|uniref:Uncharacterized protein n=1 Tax=Aspergillus ochraceoroseus IBT 24754 TaxID=1392256 RepID=A0A2T5LNI4_9EURO|nr:uncharacterized protein P175DRAFT_0535574 [Aspergillus ochraceoroseus IBT 24754]PTU17832.1 hypothetical protein P175DRAFT_0535574 [Aspergillus ochraceoroseus IBT 24754]